MNTNDPIEKLLAEAREVSPFGEPQDFGFETRLRAGLAAIEPSVSDAIASLSWKFSLASLPILVAIAVFLAFQQQTHLLQSGIGDFVINWSHYLPVDI